MSFWSPLRVKGTMVVVVGVVAEEGEAMVAMPQAMSLLRLLKILDSSLPWEASEIS